MGMYASVYAVPPAALEAASEVDELIEEISPSESVSLEKAWHGLHYLLTGNIGEEQSDDPLAFIVGGGEEFGEDLGYGPARLLRPQQVSELAAALAKIDDAGLWRRFDPKAMSKLGVYPDCWSEPESDLKEEYLHYFQEVKKLVAAAAKSGAALLVTLN